METPRGLELDRYGVRHSAQERGAGKDDKTSEDFTFQPQWGDIWDNKESTVVGAKSPTFGTASLCWVVTLRSHLTFLDLISSSAFFSSVLFLRALASSSLLHSNRVMSGLCMGSNTHPLYSLQSRVYQQTSMGSLNHPLPYPPCMRFLRLL